MALPQNRPNAIAMPLDYLNEASDEVRRLFARLDDVVRLAVQAMQELEELQLAMGECPPPAQSGSESGKT